MLWFTMIRQKGWQHLQRKTAQFSSALPSTLSCLLCCGMANFMCPAPFVFGLEKSVNGSLKNPWQGIKSMEQVSSWELWSFFVISETSEELPEPGGAFRIHCLLWCCSLSCPFLGGKNGSVASAMWPGLCSYFFKCPYKKEITDLDLCFIISRRSLLH